MLSEWDARVRQIFVGNGFNLFISHSDTLIIALNEKMQDVHGVYE